MSWTMDRKKSHFVCSQVPSQQEQHLKLLINNLVFFKNQIDGFVVQLVPYSQVNIPGCICSLKIQTGYHANQPMEHLSIIYIIELYPNQMSGHKTRQVVLRLLRLTFSCRVPDSKVPGPRGPIPPTLLLLGRCCHRSRTSETWTCGLKRTTVNLTLGRKEITIKIRMKRRRIFCTSAQCETNIVWIVGKIITPFF